MLPQNCQRLWTFSYLCTFLLFKKKSPMPNTATQSIILHHFLIVSFVHFCIGPKAPVCLGTCVNCVLTFVLIFLNLFSKVSAGLDLEIQLFIGIPCNMIVYVSNCLCQPPQNLCYTFLTKYFVVDSTRQNISGYSILKV